ncbi:MAG TPA: sensor histidine kinase N-terminal domain-containing protein [Burkholderiales bacterium]|nr:sensor histidine kinase N-terminal domain-containing protein [Burkholderiales bacterium]
MTLRKSLRVELLAWMAPPVLTALLVSTTVCYLVASTFATRAFDSQLLNTGQVILDHVRLEGGEPRLALPRAMLTSIESDLYRGDKFRVVARSGETVAGDPNVPAPEDWPGRRTPVQFFDAAIGRKPVRVAALSLFAGSDEPAAMVLVREDLDERKALLRDLFAAVLVPQLLLTVVVIALLWVGVRRALRPVERVATAITRRGWSDLRPVSDKHTPEELQPLMHAVNDLMQRLEQALGSQKQFIEDAAHQLRTPLAGLMTQIDRAARTGDSDSLRKALEQLQHSARRATRIVNQLLTLARAEPSGSRSRDFERLDLARLVQETCAEWVPQALAANVDLGFSGEERPIMVTGDPLLLQEMMNNLIDNAIRYGRRPGMVTVRLETSPAICLSVEDDGPGIPEGECDRVFERFYRLRGSPPGGSGLGLAIVREIAHAHGAEVRLERVQPAGGTLIRIAFGQWPATEP